METFEEYLETIVDISHREKLKGVLDWISDKFPNLGKRIAWSQPMFTNNGTFIIGFSSSKKHFSVAPEGVTIEKFSEDIKKSGYTHTREIFRIPWDKEVDYDLLKRIIEFNIEDKKDTKTFWR